MGYDNENIFAKILRKEIPAKIVAENGHALAFHDIHPQARFHILVIPKGAYSSFDDFAQKASHQEIAALMQLAAEVAQDLGLRASGYRILANHGKDAHQEVPHFHLHIFGGEPLGPMLASPERR